MGENPKNVFNYGALAIIERLKNQKMLILKN